MIHKRPRTFSKLLSQKALPKVKLTQRIRWKCEFLKIFPLLSKARELIIWISCELISVWQGHFNTSTLAPFSTFFPLFHFIHPLSKQVSKLAKNGKASPVTRGDPLMSSRSVHRRVFISREARHWRALHWRALQQCLLTDLQFTISFLIDLILHFAPSARRADRPLDWLAVSASPHHSRESPERVPWSHFAHAACVSVSRNF